MWLAATGAALAHSFEFVAEHMPEAAMNNRLATLPLWDDGAAAGTGWQFAVQAGVEQIATGALSVRGPALSVAAWKPVNGRWAVHIHAFRDDLRFAGNNDQRTLDTRVAQPPLALPAEALFTDLQGRLHNSGAGIAVKTKGDGGWLGGHEWIAGMQLNQLRLSGYRATYRVLEGPSRGATGFVNYSGNYNFAVPFAGLGLVRQIGSWSLNAHALLALPLPRRGVQGRIAGPGFDLSGDTAKAGNGKHVGDVSLTLGLDITFVPWGLTAAVGTFASQPLIEAAVHKGINRNWVISMSKRI